MENIKKSDNLDIEIDGRTMGEAIQKALAYFKVPKNELVIKVLSEEKRGLFGMQGAKPAKIAVRLKTKEGTSKKP
jgi:predicted RNA-binding protein Jag